MDGWNGHIMRNLRILLYLMENEMATSWWWWWWWCDGRKDETKNWRSNPNPEEKSVDKSIKLSWKLCKTQREGRRGAPPLWEEVRCKIAGEWAYELGGVAPTKLAPLQHAGTQTPIAMPPPSSINKINQSINPLPFPPFLFPVFKTWWVYSCSSIIVCAPYHLLSSVLTWWIHALSLSLSLSLYVNLDFLLRYLSFFLNEWSIKHRPVSASHAGY